jgi:hypothetical protein
VERLSKGFFSIIKYLFLILLMAHARAETGIAACSPASGGNPSSLPWLAPPESAEEASCDSGADTSVLSNAEGGGLGAGNPIHLLTGNKYQRDVDMPALPGFMGLEVTRYYNSSYADPRFTFTGIGRGWRLSYDVHLVIGAKAIQVLQADGSRIIFAIDPTNPLACATQKPEQGTLSISDRAGRRNGVSLDSS